MFSSPATTFLINVRIAGSSFTVGIVVGVAMGVAVKGRDVVSCVGGGELVFFVAADYNQYPL